MFYIITILLAVIWFTGILTVLGFAFITNPFIIISIIFIASNGVGKHRII